MRLCSQQRRHLLSAALHQPQPVSRIPKRCRTAAAEKEEEEEAHAPTRARRPCSKVHPSRSAMEQDYSSWSHADLIARVSRLEGQLRAQHEQAERRPQPQPQLVPRRKQQREPKKAPRAFDPSRYSTRLIALKFAYLGARYNGFEYHANNTTPLPTVEEEMWRALRKTRLIFPTFPDGSAQSRDGGGSATEGGVDRAGQRVEESGWEASHGWHPWQGGERKEEVCWDGCEYSKCGRTDRGVSAFGQVIGVRVRSNRPTGAVSQPLADSSDVYGDRGEAVRDVEDPSEPARAFCEEDELPYIQLLNRVLPPDIRVLAWCPRPPDGFSARFNCRERRYRYFFTNPAYMPLPARAGERAREGWLDVAAMQRAAKKLEGLHDFRNFCKIDPSKQITTFERRIFSARIHEVTSSGDREVTPSADSGETDISRHDAAKMYFFEVRGSAFLWHQVRHMVAILFLVGQGYEAPALVDELLDTKKVAASPAYEMASDTPLVLWDCIFPDPSRTAQLDHAAADDDGSFGGYSDEMDWIYVGDPQGGRDQSKRSVTGVEDGKYGRNGIMEDVWALWRSRKMEETLCGNLMDVVAKLGDGLSESSDAAAAVDPASFEALGAPSDRIFDGSQVPRIVGKYTPVMQRKTKESPEVMNARYAARKGVGRGANGKDESGQDTDRP